MFRVLTSQNLTVPSLLTEHNSSSLTGLNPTFSTAPVWPLSSVDWRTLGLSTFPATAVSHETRVIEMAQVVMQGVWTTYILAGSCLRTLSQPTSLMDSTRSPSDWSNFSKISNAAHLKNIDSLSWGTSRIGVVVDCWLEGWEDGLELVWMNKSHPRRPRHGGRTGFLVGLKCSGDAMLPLSWNCLVCMRKLFGQQKISGQEKRKTNAL